MFGPEEGAMEIQELADHANSYFIRGKRDSGETFWTLKRRHPVWIKDMIQAAHGDMFPDDYKYEFVVDTLDALEEGSLRLAFHAWMV